LIEDLALTAQSKFFVNGQEIIDYVQKTVIASTEARPVSLMVLDMQMPVKNGLQVVQEVRALFN
jgi:CheY-like chemotaxis protein